MVISNKEVLEKIKSIANNQSEVSDASHDLLKLNALGLRSVIILALDYRDEANDWLVLFAGFFFASTRLLHYEIPESGACSIESETIRPDFHFRFHIKPALDCRILYL